MERRRTVADYLGMPETMKPQELVYGVVREPPAPLYGHQAIVLHIGSTMQAFVRRRKLGEVAISPVDVVFDRERALVLQPDVIFVSAARAHIISDRVWGAPDLVVEVLSPRTASRDRTRKLEWYRQYGVKECWLVDDAAGQVTVVHLDPAREPGQRVYRGPERVYSSVLRGFRPTAKRLASSHARR
jgi:Uma2 family endonuclease